MPGTFGGARHLRLVIAVAVFAAFGLTGVASAQEAAPVRVAVIDVQRILTDSEAGKAALESLRTLANAKQQEIEAKRQELADLRSRYEEGQLSLSEERQEEMQGELQDGVIELRRMEDDAQRTLGASREKAFDEIEKAVLPIIQEVGQEFRYTAIFNKFQSGLLFALEEIDITNLILERFNAAPAGQPVVSEGGE